jgi:hypothetical protein
MSHINPFYMDEDEDLIVKTRKHWFLVTREFLGIGLLIVLPTLGLTLVPTEQNLLQIPIVLFLFCLWMMVCVMGIATIWTNYYLDIWVVTNKRIVNIEQISLFNRDITTMRLERVQDATIEIRGFFADYFNFGNLIIHSAAHGNEGEKTFEGIPDPEGVKAIILEHVDNVTEHKSKLEFTESENPNSTV